MECILHTGLELEGFRVLVLLMVHPILVQANIFVHSVMNYGILDVLIMFSGVISESIWT